MLSLHFGHNWKSVLLRGCNPAKLAILYRSFAVVQVHLKSEFPRLVSYQRFVGLIPQMLVPMLACCLTPGNVDDRRPVPFLVKRLHGKLIGDRGYISASLAQLLFEQGLHLITRLRKNMSNRLMHLCDKLLVRKRATTRTIIDQLKNISQIEHSRHRSPTNFVVHLRAFLLAYCHQPKKPSLHLDQVPRLSA